MFPLFPLLLFLVFRLVHSKTVSVDDGDSAWSYNDALWDRNKFVADGRAYLDHVAATYDPNAIATLKFTGTSLSYWSPSWPMTITTQLVLDGESVTLDLQDYSQGNVSGNPDPPLPAKTEVKWTKNGLENREHTLIVKAGKWAVVDRVDYEQPDPQSESTTLDGVAQVTTDVGISSDSSAVTGTSLASSGSSTLSTAVTSFSPVTTALGSLVTTSQAGGMTTVILAPTPSESSSSGFGATKTSSAPTGAIIGGVLGGIALMALLIFLLFLFCQRNSLWKRQAKESNAMEDGITPLPVPVHVPVPPRSSESETKEHAAEKRSSRYSVSSEFPSRSGAFEAPPPAYGM